MNILDYSDLTRVKFIQNPELKPALNELVNISTDYLYDNEKFFSSLLEREQLMSTGMGFEVAFPHSKNDSVIDFFLTIGISYAGINWNSFDGQDVKLIFLIGGLVEQQEKYLRLLASLSNLVKKPDNRKSLLEAQNEIEFFETFKKQALKENQAI